ncbi:GNAT family N-acetyltransferase [Rhodococcus sp. ARC_M5]|uniref:GNAT family N-acetyltransferase n=1 Tax=Rhodococcus sp. ARC_M5 TaxID=2928851 RepID=UPI0027E11E67|nr:GNAT family N-acetyltransferase [Rhodococcus sp. ARC_M5]MCJ0895050.1 GNAT family N-acetyltransferase [Rhodococcus sp. ARC_M5]
MTRILLRPAVPTDADFLFSMASDVEVVRWIGDGAAWNRAYFDRRFARALSAGDTRMPDVPRWFIGTEEDRHPVGLLSLIRRSDHIEVGYWVDPAQWGRGYAGELLDLAQDHTDGLPMVAQVYRANSASRRVLERAGFALVDDGDPLIFRAPPR